LVDKFLELFQVKIDPTKALKDRSYGIVPVASEELVADFHLQFSVVQAMLDTPLAEEIQKRQFLKALRERLRSLFALMDASTVPLTEIINMALNLDHWQLRLGLSQFHAIAPSSKAKENAFQ
jgi:hypothetical protein